MMSKTIAATLDTLGISQRPILVVLNFYIFFRTFVIPKIDAIFSLIRHCYYQWFFNSPMPFILYSSLSTTAYYFYSIDCIVQIWLCKIDKKNSQTMKNIYNVKIPSLFKIINICHNGFIGLNRSGIGVIRIDRVLFVHYPIYQIFKTVWRKIVQIHIVSILL